MERREPPQQESRKPKPAQPPKPKPAQPKSRARVLGPVAAVVGVVFVLTVICGLGAAVTMGLVPRPHGGGGATDASTALVAPSPAPAPAAPSPEPAAPAASTPDQEWATVSTLRKAGDLAGAADLLRQLISTGDTHPYADPALLALLEVERELLEKSNHGPSATPKDAPVEQKTDDGTVVYSLTPDRRAWVEAANAVLSHNFPAATDLSGPNLAKQVQDERPEILLELGEMMCSHNRYEEARNRLRYLQENLPNSKQAEEAKKLPKLCLQPPDDDSQVYPCPTGGFLVKNEMPTPPRRLPKQSLFCNQPPPGGQFQTEAIQRQRAKDCAGSLVAVQAGMKVSEDHCTLYHLAWTCFSEEYLRKLESNDDPLEDWDDIVLVLPNLEGSREKREIEAKDPKWSRFPSWYREAPDGLEFRLEQWSKDPKMQEATADLFGAPTVADQLTKDLFLEGRLAVQLACTPPDKRASKIAFEDAWARRVYVLARALHGPAGVLVKENRPDMQTTLRAMLNRAVTPYDDGSGHKTAIPEIVQYAYDVGIENRPPPGPASVRTGPDLSEPIIESDDVPVIKVEKGAGGRGQ
jgi:hypothetical protein